MVDALERRPGRRALRIGGDGTLRGARAIAQEVARRERPITVIGVPKTIDNDRLCRQDLRLRNRRRGRRRGHHLAHTEAEGADHGIAIVKLMGRDSGFIAAAVTLANSVVDFLTRFIQLSCKTHF